MAKFKILTSASPTDPPTTVVPGPVAGSVAQVSDLYALKTDLDTAVNTLQDSIDNVIGADLSDLEQRVSLNTINITEVISGAPEEMDTLKEIADNLDFDDFLAGLGSNE